MGQPAAEARVAAAWAQGVEHVWARWSAPLLAAEALLLRHEAREALPDVEVRSRLQASQYAAHAASELLAGTPVPSVAGEAHMLLVETLQSCRDALGVLAVRAELDELDQESCEIAWDALVATRSAFESVRATSRVALVELAGGATVPGIQVPGQGVPSDFSIARAPMTEDEWREQDPSHLMLVVLWALVGVCAVLFATLVVQVVGGGLVG